MFVNALRRTLRLLALTGLAACHRHPFIPASFPSKEALFQASLQQLKLHHWGNAENGFEKLTTDLPARDPLLPAAYYYLGEAHTGQKEYILAAQAYSRVPESFPEDTLAGPATFETGVSYAKLWRKPSLDPDYGQTAISTLQSFIAAYPDSPLKPRAQKEIDRLTEWLAIKNYDTGMFYYRRKAYDPAIIYFNDVERLYPTTQHAKLALIQLVKSYKQIKYPEEIAQTCATLYQKYPGDKDVKETCGPPPAPATATPKP